MDKFQNKYRVLSHRKPNWDYSADALYFLTIITQNRECNLGSIVNKEMILSDYGKIVEIEWFKSFEIRDELLLHEFILMPNHLHTIVEIYDQNRGVTNRGDTDRGDVDREDVDRGDTDRGDADRGDTDRGDTPVETHGRVSLPPRTDEPRPIPLPYKSDIQIKRNPPIRMPKSISSFIAGFKSAINTKIDNYIDLHLLNVPKYNRNNHFFQPNYHDHIIRNDFEYQNISNYIINNPAKWADDTFYG